MLQYSMSQILQHQEDLLMYLLDHVPEGTWMPPEDKNNVPWKFLEDLTEEERAEVIAYNNEKLEESLKHWNLSELILDKPGAPLALVDEPEEWILDEGYKPGDRFYFLGECHRGHIIVADCHFPAKIYSMAHDFNFYLVPYGEI